MFKINTNAVHNWKVLIPWPKPDGSGHSMQGFTAKFKRIPADEFLGHTRDIVEAATAEGKDGVDEIRVLLRDVFVGFTNIVVVDDDGNTVETSDQEIMDALLMDVAGARALYQAYNDMIAGQPTKN